MQNLESCLSKNLSATPLFYDKYVDNIVLVFDILNIDEILNTFNSYRLRLKFTRKFGGNILTFLDICLKKENALIFYWYRRSTF